MAATATKRKLNDDENQAESSNKITDIRLKSHTEAGTNSGDLGCGVESAFYYNTAYYEQRGHWVAMYDWNSGSYYYVNTTNSQTQWEKPGEWDSPLLTYTPADQYFDGSIVCEKEEKTCSHYKQTAADVEAKVMLFSKRPARQQIDPEEKKKLNWIPEGVTEYNIWYDRWVGEHWKGDRDFGPSETRCCVNKDAGCTKATLHDPNGTKRYFCIYFAKGCCHLGSECGYIHNIPLDKDENRIGLAHDVFGRERHRTHKENMGGVGTFDKDCNTLYVGGLGRHKNLEELLWTEFGEWGEIEDIRIIPKLHIAFVRYKNRVNAEFAKAAMSDQMLGNCEVMNIRWAYDDPNPKARKEELLKAKQKLLQSLDDRGFLQEVAMQPRRLTNSGVTGKYANTDNQYHTDCVTAHSNDLTSCPAQEQPASVGPLTKEQTEQAQTLQRLNEAFERVESSQRTLGASTTSVTDAQTCAVESQTCGEHERLSSTDKCYYNQYYTGPDYYQCHPYATNTSGQCGAWGADNASYHTQHAAHGAGQSAEAFQDPYRFNRGASTSSEGCEVKGADEKS